MSIETKKRKETHKKAVVYVHSAFLRKSSQSLHWVIITGSIWSVGTCGQGYLSVG